MKRIFLFLLFVLLFKFSFSQDIGFNFGIILANQLHKNVPTDLPDYKSTQGISLGIDLSQKISKNLNIISGLNFSQKGGNRDWNSNETGFVYKIKNTLNYIEVPLSIMLCNTDIKTTPYISFGVYASFLVSGKVATLSRLEVTELFERNDFGIGISTGIKVDRLRFDIGYAMGLKNLNTFGNEFIVKNRSWNLSIRYFPIL